MALSEILPKYWWQFGDCFCSGLLCNFGTGGCLDFWFGCFVVVVLVFGWLVWIFLVVWLVWVFVYLLVFIQSNIFKSQERNGCIPVGSYMH